MISYLIDNEVIINNFFRQDRLYSQSGMKSYRIHAIAYSFCTVFMFVFILYRIRHHRAGGRGRRYENISTSYESDIM